MFSIQAASGLPSDVSAFDKALSALKSSISTLESSIDSLNARSEFWEKLLPWFTAAVVIGVAMELWVIWHDWHEDNETWALTFFGINRTLKPSLRKVLVEVVSVIFVAGGVFGELAIGVVITRINGQLRTLSADLRSKSDQLVALVTQEAGNAAVSAKTAHDEADKVGKEADAIQKRLNSASEKLGQVELQVRAQGPRWKRLKEGQDSFIESLRPFKDQKVVLVTCEPRQAPWQQEEEYLFELRLLNLLTQYPGQTPIGAGWSVIAGPPYSCAGLGIIGVWILYSSPAVKGAADALGDALSKLTISAQVTQTSGTPSQFAQQKRKPDDLNALFEAVASDPTGIYVLTGQNPQSFEPKK